MRAGRTITIGAPAVISVMLTACVVAPATPPPRGVLVSGPPPAPLHEDRSPAPAPLAAWIGGYWHWTGLEYAWIPGHWEAAPPMGAAWRPPVYVQNNGAFFYEPGGWSTGAPATMHQETHPQPTAVPPTTYQALH